MRGWLTAAALVLASGTAQAAAPDLGACPRLQANDGERQRTRALGIPRAVATVIRSDMDHYAVSTLSGGTVCVDTREMEDTQHDHALSADQRFLSFSWQGYETGGYVVIDRSGKGQVVETGAKPVFSPSGKRLAAVEWSESGFGTLNGFAVWQVQAEGLRQMARLEDIPAMAAWRIDRWAADHCVELSAVPLDKAPDDPRDIDLAPRTRFAAREMMSRAGGNSWVLAAAPMGCAAR